MRYDGTVGKLYATTRDWAVLGRIATFKAQTEFNQLGLWRLHGDEFLWESIVRQICNRGGTRWFTALEKRGQLSEFRARLSLVELLNRSVPERSLYVREQMDTFRVGRFREDNTRSVVANFKNFIGEDGCMNLRTLLDDFESIAEPVGETVQARERHVREYIMHTLVFYQHGRQYYARRKPPSDFLIHIGFARTLLAFDSRMKKTFRAVFAITASDENYEPIEDWFLAEAYPRTNITPSEFDRIIFQHQSEILQLAAQTLD